MTVMKKFYFIENAVSLWEKKNVNDTVKVLDVYFTKDDVHECGNREYMYFISNVIINGEKFKKIYEIDLTTNLICTSMNY